MTREELKNHLDNLRANKYKYITYEDNIYHLVERSIVNTYMLNINNILNYRLFKEIEKEIQEEIYYIIAEKLTYREKDREYLEYSLFKDVNAILLDLGIIKEEIIDEVLYSEKNNS